MPRRYWRGRDDRKPVRVWRLEGQGRVGAVAKWAFFGGLTGAKGERPRAFCHILQGLEPGTFVGAVAPGLALAAATGAPPIGFTLDDIDGDRGVLCDDRFGHDRLLVRI